MHAFEKHEIMLVAFMVPEKQVLAVGGIEFLPIVDGFLYGGNGGMEMDVEFDAQIFQRVNDFLLSFAHFMCDVIGVHFGGI